MLMVRNNESSLEDLGSVLSEEQKNEGEDEMILTRTEAGLTY